MKKTKCDYCNSRNLIVKKVSMHNGQYCKDCGKWLCWVSNEELGKPNYKTKRKNNVIHYKFGA